jgi:hypothetical protein
MCWFTDFSDFVPGMRKAAATHYIMKAHFVDQPIAQVTRDLEKRLFEASQGRGTMKEASGDASRGRMKEALEGTMKLRKAPIAEVTRDLENRLLGASGGAVKEPYAGLDDDGDGYGYDDDDENAVNPQEEVQEFETDLRNAFDWNKITFATIPLHQWAWWVAFVFVVMTCLVSGQLIWSHLDNYEKPEVQKYVVRIIFMTPIYAIVALLSLTFDNAAPLLNVLRDCYEAFTLYNFVKMLYVWCGGERKVMDVHTNTHTFSLSLSSPPPPHTHTHTHTTHR